jgi:hypothetical protein
LPVLGFNSTGIRLAQYFQGHPNDFRFEGILDEEKALFVDEKGNSTIGCWKELKLRQTGNKGNLCCYTTTYVIGSKANA